MVEKAPVVIGSVFGYLKVFFIRQWLFFNPCSKYSISLRKTQETHCKTAAFVIICKKTLKKETLFYEDFYHRRHRQYRSICNQGVSGGWPQHGAVDPSPPTASLPVTEAALRAGFGSIATFNRVFRERKGMSPTQYRKMLYEKK